MASTSTSSTLRWKNEVFLSFRGKDTSHNLVSHLYQALLHESVHVFIDDELRRGEKIGPSLLLQQIRDSMISVVVFSKGYANSKRCLDDLQTIMECHENHGQMVIPVFYGVDPSHVEDPTSGIYRDDFERHERDLKDVELGKVNEWKTAMVKAANISGWDSYVTRPDSNLVAEVVKVILKKLETTFSSGNLDDLVGINPHTVLIKKLLSTRARDVRILGIWGMGGIGKTTIARVIYNQIKSEFEGSCFLSNVGEELRTPSGLIDLGKRLLSDVLDQENIKIHSPKIGESVYFRMLSRRKVLIVLDDITRAEQLEVLAGKTRWFGPGSRIIVTGRDKHVLKKFVDDNYQVVELDHDDALLLFSRNAFKQDHPIEDFEAMSNSFLEYAFGNPLALKVLGSFLNGRSRREWGSALERLEKYPHKDIQDVLRISYDGLHDEDKVIFLYVACLFNGEKRNRVIQVLNACDLSTDIGLGILVDKCLVTVSPYDELHMHDLLQEMGMGIVREDCRKNSGKLSKLCNYEHICKLSNKDPGIEGLFLDMSKTKEMRLKRNAFESMDNLKLFKFYFSNSRPYNNKVHLLDGLENLPDQLRYFYWNQYPAKSLPSNFQPANLVELHLPESDVKRLWKGTKDLQNLKVINLRNAKNLKKLPELSKAPNVVDVHLVGCSNLVKVPTSISHLSQLTQMLMSGCESIRTLPSLINLASLEYLDLQDCSKLERFPEVSRSIEDLRMDGTAISDVPSSIAWLDKLVFFSMENCINLESVSSSIWELKSLGSLFLNGCTNLVNLPKASENSLYSEREIILYVQSCEKLRSFPELPLDVRTVYASNCPSMETVFGIENFLKFQNVSNGETNTRLDFSDCLTLDNNALGKVVANAIEDMATQVKDCPQRAPGFTLWYPGDKIPDCFGYRAMRNRITFQLPPYLRDATCLFVLCAVVNSTYPPIIQCYGDFKDTNGGGNSVRGFYTSATANLPLKSKNVVVWFTENCYVNMAEKCSPFRETDHVDVWIEFHAFDTTKDVIGDCGVALLYVKGEECKPLGTLADLAINGSEFDEDEPWTKRLKRDIAEPSSRRQELWK